MSAAPPGVVLDCMVYLQATANAKSSSARLLDLLDLGEITLYVSRETLREVRQTISDPVIRARLTGINDVVIEALFRRLERKAILIKQIPSRFEYARDPKDEPYVNLAIAAGASYLVSRDKDLLDLMKWNTEEGRDFQKRFRSLKIVTPEVFPIEARTGVQP